jgi:hypothetical protein
MSQLTHPAVDVHRIRVISEAVLDAAYRAACDNDLSRTAATLDAAFGPDGRHLSESQLRVCLKQRERNYARLEWVPLLVALPGSELLPILATAAGYDVTKKRALTDAEWRAKAERELVAAGPFGAHVLERIGR